MPEPLFEDILQEQKAPPKRTWPVTLICILYLVILAMTIGQVLTRPGAQVKIILVFLVPIGLFLCWLIYGLWNMKKWAGIILMVLLSMAAVRRWWSREDVYASFISAVTVITLATQLKKMGK